MSKPFGQVGAPNSRKTRLKYAISRSGSIIGPLSRTSAAKSYSPELSSEKRKRSRWPPSHSILETLIIVETCDAFERKPSTRSAPILRTRKTKTPACAGFCLDGLPELCLKTRFALPPGDDIPCRSGFPGPPSSAPAVIARLDRAIQ